jgi:hypothetical protein
MGTGTVSGVLRTQAVKTIATEKDRQTATACILIERKWKSRLTPNRTQT